MLIYDNQYIYSGPTYYVECESSHQDLIKLTNPQRIISQVWGSRGLNLVFGFVSLLF